jgi:GNAT superfamily N-acetyltransferase
MTLRELTTLEDMLEQFTVLQELYPTLTRDSYQQHLEVMLLTNQYGQVAVFDRDCCVAVSGFWIGTKLWCGKYLEIDNLIVSQHTRSNGVGKLMVDFLIEKAQQESCTLVALDSYTTNFKAHKFFYNRSFEPRGFHFIRVLNDKGIR